MRTFLGRVQGLKNVFALGVAMAPSLWLCACGASHRASSGVVSVPSPPPSSQMPPAPPMARAASTPLVIKAPRALAANAEEEDIDLAVKHPPLPCQFRIVDDG